MPTEQRFYDIGTPERLKAIEAERFVLLHVERALQALLLAERRLILDVHRFDDLRQLALQLGLDHLA